MKRILPILVLAALLPLSCVKEPASVQETDVEIPSPIHNDDPEPPVTDAIVLDLDFYNAEGVNPLGFGDLTAAEESPDGDIYDFCGFPITVCKGSQSGARYRFRSLSLLYPASVTGNCLVFEKQNSWIGLPGISGYVLQSVTYEHGNGYVKRMVIKKSLNPSVTIAYTSNDDHFIATADGPDSETISFFSNGTTDVSVTGSPEVGEPIFLQFITTGGTRVYRIKATYMRELPPVPGPSETADNFPKVSIHTAGAEPIVSKEDYVFGSFEYSDPEGINPGERNIAETDVARFRGRGNTTWNRFPKKPYKIKLDGKVSFFGLPKDKEWCLLANHSDKSLLRNIVAMKISSILGFGWTPQMHTVELWLNDVYQGAYTLSEHKKVSSGRIDITVPEDGGRDMYLEIDQLMDETTCFRTERYSVPVMYSDPEIPDEEMLSETKAWFKGLEDALAAEPLGDYASFIDVPSFIDHYIIQELAKNVDGRMNKGCFITRSQGGPLKVCHEWDFDISFGNCNTLSTLSGIDNGPTGFLIKEFTGALKGDGWYPRLFSDPTFVSAVKARWNEIYPELCTIPSFIDEQAAIITPAAEHNFLRWPVLGQYVWPNVSWPATYVQEVGNLKSFYSARLAWLDGNINSL